MANPSSGTSFHRKDGNKSSRARRDSLQIEGPNIQATKRKKYGQTRTSVKRPHNASKIQHATHETSSRKSSSPSNSTPAAVSSNDLALKLKVDEDKAYQLIQHLTSTEAARKLRSVSSKLAAQLDQFEGKSEKEIKAAAYAEVLANVRKSSLQRDTGTHKTWSYDWTVALKDLQTALETQEEQVLDHGGNAIHSSKTKRVEKMNNRPVSSILLPRIWTQSTFVAYVYKLSQSRISRYMNRRFLESYGIFHQEQVRKYFEELLFVEENKHLMSKEAFEYALRFFYRYEMVDSVRRIFLFMQEINFPWSASHFDIVLRNAALRHDLYSFTVLLKDALAFGFNPTATTWASLVLCLESHQARDTVVSIMAERHLFQDTRVCQDVTEVMLAKELSEPVDGQRDSATPMFLDLGDLKKLMDSKYGKNWFCIRTANVILKRICMLPSGEDIALFLQEMTMNGATPNIDSMNLLLQRCLRARNLDAGLTVLRYFSSKSFAYPDHTSYEFLFENAWDARAANTCRILWSNACIFEGVNHSMETKMIDSLTKQPPAGPKVFKDVWAAEAGKLIVGIDPRQNDPDERIYLNSGRLEGKPRFRSVKDTIAQLLPLGDCAGKQHNRELLAKALVRYDQNLCAHFHVAGNQGLDQLFEAYEMDRRWALDNLRLKPTREKMDMMMAPALLSGANPKYDGIDVLDASYLGYSGIYMRGTRKGPEASVA